MILFLLFCAGPLFGQQFVDLEEKAQDFVLETTQLEIPGYPHAFNPSIIRWQDQYILSFRTIPDHKTPYISYIGLLLLDKNFLPAGEPQILPIREIGSEVPSRIDDLRLVYVADKIFVVYSDNDEPLLSKGGFRVWIGEVEFDGTNFSISRLEKLRAYEGESRCLREKNWVPFDYRGNLCLSYSLIPHKVFLPIRGTGTCLTIAQTDCTVDWPFGILRGGTMGVLGIVEGEYFSLFHSSIAMESLHSEGKKMPHYFMGAYTFSAEPPFALSKISPEPIIGKKFYNGPNYQRYWGSVRVVFPGGILFDEEFIWVAYGRQDHEVWIAKLDRKKLVESLVPVQSSP